MNKMMKIIAKERPVGTPENTKILKILEKHFSDSGFETLFLPFECTVWKNEESVLKIGEKEFQISSSPFSEPFEGNGKIETVSSLEELRKRDVKDTLLIVSGELAKEPLQPKDYPFYFPEEHKNIISLLEQKKPQAILAAAKKHMMCGLDPFPLFEDGNFMIPSAYLSDRALPEIEKAAVENKNADLKIRSEKRRVRSCQLVASQKVKNPVGKIVLCAHMDSKYNTPGALDNAAGIIVLMKAAEKIKSDFYDIDIVPFNGEEYYEASGELEYLKYSEEKQDQIKLVINIDSPAHIHSKISISLYNASPEIEEKVNTLTAKNRTVVKGTEWYAGDHAVFAFRGIPCLAVTSSDLFEGALE